MQISLARGKFSVGRMASFVQSSAGEHLTWPLFVAIFLFGLVIQPVWRMSVWHPSDPAERSTPSEASGPRPSASPAGTWYELSVECNFCPYLHQQTLNVANLSAAQRFADQLVIADTLSEGWIVTKTSGSGVRSSPIYIHVRPEKWELTIIERASSVGQRTSDIYARILVITSLAEHRVMYGKRYLINIYAPEGFRSTPDGYQADETYLATDRIIANIDDVRVASLNERRKTYQPSAQVQFTLDGYVTYIRDTTNEKDIEVARSASVKSEADALARLKLFRILVQQGDKAYHRANYDEAKSQYKAASAIQAAESLVYANLGAVYQVQNLLLEAENAYRLAIELDSSDLDSVFNLAGVLEQSGRPTDALREYQKVVDARPTDSVARENYARLREALSR